MSDDPIEKVETAEAWNEFCDLLKKAGEVLLRPELEVSTFDRGEGLRYLSRLLRAGLPEGDRGVVVDRVGPQ